MFRARERQFVAFCIVLILTLTASLHAAESPNILFAIADDWSWPHAGAYGDPVVKTPTFDRVAREGILFSHAFVVSPSCTPSRSSVLTGQEIHRLGPAGNLWSWLESQYVTYVDLLEDAGYEVGYSSKGWGPGTLEHSGRVRNPAGPVFSTFSGFIDQVPEDQPFCYWLGSFDPHRGYRAGSGVDAGMNPAEVDVPPFLPDSAEVRADITDYYFEVQRFDDYVGQALDLLEQRGMLANTLVVVTSDNGMPFPRAKANLYDGGTRMPMAVMWGDRIKPARMSDAFISFTDFAPTFLEAAGVAAPDQMTGRSFLPLLNGESESTRDRVFVERERHAFSQVRNLSYPSRAVRTRDYLYIRNFEPDRWPAGDPDFGEPHAAYGGIYSDIDGSPSKNFIVDHRAEPAFARLAELTLDKRPAEELYSVNGDPGQLNNLAADAAHAEALARLRGDVERWMSETGDPRATGGGAAYDEYQYYGRERNPARARR